MVLNDVHNVYSDNLLNASKCKGLPNKGPIEVFVGKLANVVILMTCTNHDKIIKGVSCC